MDWILMLRGSAHKAAYPDKYPIKPEARLLYPALEGIEQRYGPTKIHLQVYDGTTFGCQPFSP